jgi:hypothetical protein
MESPAIQTSSPPVTLEDLKQLFLEVIQATSKPPDSAESPKAVKLDAQEDTQAETDVIRALKLEFKTVNEVYVPNKA